MKKKHLFHYLVLLILLGIGGTTIISLNFDRQLQVYAVITTAAAYVLWGIVHHKEETDLHLKVLLEYLLLATLGGAILISLIIKA